VRAREALPAAAVTHPRPQTAHLLRLGLRGAERVADDSGVHAARQQLLRLLQQRPADHDHAGRAVARDDVLLVGLGCGLVGLGCDYLVGLGCDLGGGDVVEGRRLRGRAWGEEARPRGLAWPWRPPAACCTPAGPGRRSFRIPASAGPAGRRPAGHGADNHPWHDTSTHACTHSRTHPRAHTTAPTQTHTHTHSHKHMHTHAPGSWPARPASWRRAAARSSC
jgi:hypothetical protein